MCESQVPEVGHGPDGVRPSLFSGANHYLHTLSPQAVPVNNPAPCATGAAHSQTYPAPTGLDAMCALSGSPPTTSPTLEPFAKWTPTQRSLCHLAFPQRGGSCSITGLMCIPAQGQMHAACAGGCSPRSANRPHAYTSATLRNCLCLCLHTVYGPIRADVRERA